MYVCEAEVDIQDHSFGFLRQGFFVYSSLSWNSLCSPGWTQTQRCACLCLLSSGIKSMCCHYSAKILLNCSSTIFSRLGSLQSKSDLTGTANLTSQFALGIPSFEARIIGSHIQPVVFTLNTILLAHCQVLQPILTEASICTLKVHVDFVARLVFVFCYIGNTTVTGSMFFQLK